MMYGLLGDLLLKYLIRKLSKAILSGMPSQLDVVIQNNDRPPQGAPTAALRSSPDGVSITASSGPTAVSLMVPDRERAAEIVGCWEAHVSLNQGLSPTPSGEVVRTFRDLACALGAEVLRDVDGLTGPFKSRFSCLTIQQTDRCSDTRPDSEPLKWTHIERPNKAAIEWAEKRAGLKPGSLARYMEVSEPSCVQRSNSCLITRTYELSLPEDEKALGKVTANPFTMLCGDGFLITLSPKPASAVQRVRNDIEGQSIQARECCSSNAIARLLVEETLELYQHSVERLSRRIENFWQSHASHTPSDADMRLSQAMRRDLRACEHSMLGFDDVLAKLDRREHDEGRPTQPELREKVRNTLSELRNSLKRCNEEIRDGENSWASLRDQENTRILTKLAILSALSLPMSVWAGIGGMNFVHPLPDPVLAGGLVASVLVSAGLVGRLIIGKSGFFKSLFKT